MACFTVVVHNLLNVDFVDLKTQRYLASVFFVILWFSLFDKLRLFESTAFYIKLTFTTIRTSFDFLIIFFISIMAIGSSIFILNQNRLQSVDPIQAEVTDIWFFDALIN